MYYNPKENNSNNLLAAALTAQNNGNRRNYSITPINPVAINTPQNNNSYNLGDSLGSLISGGTKLYNSFKNSNNSTQVENPFGDSAITNAVNNEVGSNFLGNVAPYGNLITGGIRAGLTGANGGSWKEDVPQSFFGIDNSKSDTSQALSGAANGAIMGAPFGPIGMAVGGLLGLGSSFLDDI